MKRQVMRNARLDVVFYRAAPPIENIRCEVRVNKKGLAIEAPSLSLCAHGFRVASGHFMMMANDGTVGSLHRYPGGEAFEGWWKRHGEQGFWRIRAFRTPR